MKDEKFEESPNKDYISIDLYIKNYKEIKKELKSFYDELRKMPKD